MWISCVHLAWRVSDIPCVDQGAVLPRDRAMRDVEQRVSPSTLLRAPLSVVPSDLPHKVAVMGFVYSTAYYTLKDAVAF